MRSSLINVKIDDTIRISSRDVALMLGKVSKYGHADLMKKIRKIEKNLLSERIPAAVFWIESSYTDSSGKNNIEYLVSKKGCELIAHKTTGTKGILFTVKYMEKFDSMEKALQELNLPSYQIKDPIKRAEKWIEEAKERELLNQESKNKQDLINKIKPLSDHSKKVLNSNKLITSTDVAKDLGMTATTLHKVLHLKGIIYKNKNDRCWKFYAQYQSMIPKYADYHINEYTQTLKWTEKGRKFIIELIENDKEIQDIINQIEEEKIKKSRKKNTA